MTSEEREKLEETINSEISALLVNIENLKEASRPVAPDNAIGRVTRMEAINSKSISEANLRSSKARLGQLEIALKKIHKDDFGICENCDEPIPLKRIMLIPETRRCVKCA